MSKSVDTLRSPMRKVRGLGSAKSGAKSWWLLRITAFALVPLSVWFMYALIHAMMFPTAVDVANWMASPVTVILMLLLIISTFVHTCLGLREIIEDYVKCPFSKYGLLMGNTLLCFAFATVCILAILKLHFLDAVVTTL